MSLYFEAAAVLSNAEGAGGSLKSRIYKQKGTKSSPAQLHALISEASKWSLVLKDIIERCGLLAEEKKLTPTLALLLTHDLLLAKNGVAAPASHALKLAVTRHKPRLSAEFTKARVRNGHATLDAFREAVNNGALDQGASAGSMKHPRWVRINTLKTSLKNQLSTTFSQYERTRTLSDVLFAPGTARIYYEDPNVPNLLALPPKTDLSKSSAYSNGEIIFQDKASCFPAHLLNIEPDDGDAIDGCAAPGNKTTHLAAILFEQDSSKNRKVIAYEKDRTRAATLKKMIKLASADRLVSIKAGTDFLTALPESQEFANVSAILLDPSCSGSGIVGRDDAVTMHLPEPPARCSVHKSKKRKRGDTNHGIEGDTKLALALEDSAPEETPIEENIHERLAALSDFQLRILTHAMRFPRLRKITYSTCSIHFEENENVVIRALSSSIAKAAGWRVLKRDEQVEGLKIWQKRGVWETKNLNVGNELNDQHKEICDACIRCEKGTDEGTMGFFVAAFIRDAEAKPNPALGEEDQVEEEEDEWNGFSDEASVIATDAEVPRVVHKQPKQKSRKKHV